MNTLRYAKKLEEVGFSREQAEMTIGILNEVVESNLATKQDLKHEVAVLHGQFTELSNQMNLKFTETWSHMDQEFAAVRFEIRELKSDLIIKLGAMMVTGIAVISALIKLF